MMRRIAIEGIVKAVAAGISYGDVMVLPPGWYRQACREVSEAKGLPSFVTPPIALHIDGLPIEPLDSRL